MTQTQANDDGGGIGRRGFVKIGIGATAAIGGIGAASSPAAAESCDPEESISCSYGDEPDYGVSYLVGKAKDTAHFFGLGSDEDYQDAEERSLYLQSRYDAETIKSANDSVLTTIENLLQTASETAYMQGRAAMLEALNDGKSVANATDDARQAIKDYIAPNQKNLLERWNVAVEQVKTSVDRVDELDGLSRGDIWESDTESINISEFREDTHEFVDGTEAIESKIFFRTNNNDVVHEDEMIGKKYGYNLTLVADPEDDDSDPIQPMFGSRFEDAWYDLVDAHDQAISDIETFADGIADSYQSGDIDTEDITQPSDLFSMASEDSENPYAAADLAGLGLQVNKNSKVVLDLISEDTQREGTVYLSEAPLGESLATGNVYDPTISRSTDSDGNYDDTLDDYEGTESDPIPLEGVSYLAYNTDDGSTYGQIKQKFEVKSVIDEDGEELQSASFEKSTGQQTTSTDIDELRDELQSLTDEINRVEEERREAATGGAGGFLSGSNQNLILAGAALLGGAYLFGGSS